MNMRQPMPRFTLALLQVGFILGLAVFFISRPALTQTALEGYGEFRFGMKLDQVRAIPGLTWLPFEATKVAAGTPFEMTSRTMKSRGATTIEGKRFQIETYYNSQMELISVTFEGLQRTVSPAICEQDFQEFLRKFEGRYGTFSPIDVPQTVNVGFSVSIEHRRLPGGSSSYQANVAAEKGMVATRARREFGRPKLEVSMNSQEIPNKCAIQFSAISGLPIN